DHRVAVPERLADVARLGVVGGVQRDDPAQRVTGHRLLDLAQTGNRLGRPVDGQRAGSHRRVGGHGARPPSHRDLHLVQVLHRARGAPAGPTHGRLRIVVGVALLTRRRGAVAARLTPVLLVGGVVTIFGSVVVQLVVGRDHPEVGLQLLQRAHATPRRRAVSAGLPAVTPATVVTLTRGDRAT